MPDEPVNTADLNPESSDKPALSIEGLNSAPQQRPHSPVNESPPIAASARKNNIGFIRLLAASLVIVSHSPELIDGDRSREPLARVFGTLSLGELAVDIFFLISGYLITRSYLTARHWNYVTRRVGRIYPGYLVAYFLCIFAVGPMAGVPISLLNRASYARIVGHALWLDMPRLKAFATQHFHLLNGAMWTLSYELRCYLFVLLVGVLGVYKRRVIPLCLSVVLLILHFSIANDFKPSSTGLFVFKEVLMGDSVQFIRFLFVFTCGSLFFLFQDKIKYTGGAAFLCVLGLLVLMFSDKLAEPALCSLGAYALFYFAFAAKRINLNNSYDISYGVYLYAWPFAALILLHYPAVTQVELSFFTFILAVIAGTISWYAVEKTAAKLLRRLDLPAGRRRSQGAALAG